MWENLEKRDNKCTGLGIAIGIIDNKKIKQDFIEIYWDILLEINASENPNLFGDFHCLLP